MGGSLFTFLSFLQTSAIMTAKSDIAWIKFSLLPINASSGSMFRPCTDQLALAFSTNLGHHSNNFTKFFAVYHGLQLMMPLSLLKFGLSLTQNSPWPTFLEDAWPMLNSKLLLVISLYEGLPDNILAMLSRIPQHQNLLHTSWRWQSSGQACGSWPSHWRWEHHLCDH